MSEPWPLNSPIFRKLLFSAFALIAITLGWLDFYLTRYTAAQQRSSIGRRLERRGAHPGGELESVDPARLEDWARGAETRAQARVTVIDPRRAYWRIRSTTPRAWRTTALGRKSGKPTKGAPAWPRATAPRWTWT